MNTVEFATAHSTALDDLKYLLDRTSDTAERARINALMTTVRHRQQQNGAALSSRYTVGFMTMLERERKRQQRSVSA